MNKDNYDEKQEVQDFCEESAIFVEKLRCFTRNIEHERQIAKGEITKLERSVRELERITTTDYNMIDITQETLTGIKLEFGNVRDHYASALKIYQNIILAMCTFSDNFAGTMSEYENRDIEMNKEIDAYLSDLPKVPSKDEWSVPG